MFSWHNTRTLWVTVITGLSVLALSPAASALTAPQAAAVRAVEAHVSALPTPLSASQLNAQASTVQYDVDQVIASAKASGDGSAVRALIANTSSPGWEAIHAAIAHDTGSYTLSSATTPGPYPLALDQAVVAGVARVHRALAHAAYSGCAGAGGDVWTAYDFGSNGLYDLGRTGIISKGWCGNGTSITYFAGFRFNISTGFGYCYANLNEDSGSWLIFWSWVHGGVWSQMGIGLKGACLPTTQPGSATLREAGNLHWDRYY